MSGALLLVNLDAFEAIERRPEEFIRALKRSILVYRGRPVDVGIGSCNRVAEVISFHDSSVDAPTATAALAHAKADVSKSAAV
jgi:hypothetical protein